MRRGGGGELVRSWALEPVPQLGRLRRRFCDPERSPGPRREPACARMGTINTMFIGIDVAKDRLDVHVLLARSFVVAATAKASRSWRRLAVHDAWSCSRRPAASRPSSQPAWRGRPARGGHQPTPDPGLRPSHRAKTDPMPPVIAHFAEATKPVVRPLPDHATRMLGDLLGRRRQLIEMMAAESHRLRRTAMPRYARASIACWPL